MITSLPVEDDVRVHFVRLNIRRFIVFFSMLVGRLFAHTRQHVIKADEISITIASYLLLNSEPLTRLI